MARVLEREYGGMNEVLYNLSVVAPGSPGSGSPPGASITSGSSRRWPLGQDQLKGLHANTLIPKIIGAARRYELTGDPRYRRIAEYFWREVTDARGPTPPAAPATARDGSRSRTCSSTQLSGYTQEDCVTYNMLKLTRHVFGWTADPACADYYERALWNGIVGSQHPSDGNKLYYVSMASGLWKLFGTPTQDYWCCTGIDERGVLQARRQHLLPRRHGVCTSICSPPRSWTGRSGA